MKITSSQKSSLGMDTLQEYEEDDPSQVITIDYETDESSDIDDLLVISMASAGGISKAEFQGLLSDIATPASKNGGLSRCPSSASRRYVG